MKKEIVAVCCALASVPSFAGDWVAGGATDSIDQFVDYSSIEQNNDTRGAWLIHVINRDKRGIAYTLFWAEHNCQSKKIRYMDYVHYDMSGKIIESGNEPTSWGRAIPGSIGETALKAVCQKEKPTIIFPNTSPEKVAEAIRKYRTSNGEWK